MSLHRVKVKLAGDGITAKGILQGTQYAANFWGTTTSDPCVYCGGPANTKEHIVPASLGGTGGWFNAVRACAACNQARSAKSLLAFLLERKRYNG